MERRDLLSHKILTALEREVIGQPRVVQTLVRCVTMGQSGLIGREAPVGMFLFLGPSGTGKTHVARSLARVLHGDTDRLAVVDCVHLEHPDNWQELARTISPFFRYPVPGYGDRLRAMAPLSILLVEHLEAVRPECVQALIAAFETGRIALPDGVTGSLRGCLVLMTSRICGREIYGADRQEIGFSPGSDDMADSEKARIYSLCSNAVERCWGSDFLGHLDDLLIFHRLREPHLPLILERFLGELNGVLGANQVRIELDTAARSFLLERSGRFLQHGAWYVGKVFRRYLLFPVADLVSSDGLPPGSRVTAQVEEGGEGLELLVNVEHVSEQPQEPDAGPWIDIPVEWNDDPTRLAI